MDINEAFLKDKKILIIEDDVFLGDMLLSRLKKNGAAVTLLTSAENEIDYIKEHIPDVVVLDIYLPGVNGLDFLEMLRKDAITKDISVVVLSNTSKVEDRDRAKNLGAEFLIKAGVTPDEIVEHLGKLFRDKVK